MMNKIMLFKCRPLAMGLALAAILGAGCNKSSDNSAPPASGAAASGDVIKVGEFASLTGKEASFGQMSHHGTELAIDELNASGGVLGRKLQLLTEDNQSKQGESKTIARKLISRDGVVAILGEVASGRSLEAAPICQENKIPQISPSSTNPKVTEIGDYIFRVCFIDPFQGTVMAKFAPENVEGHNGRRPDGCRQPLTASGWPSISRRPSPPAAEQSSTNKNTAAATRISTRN